MEEHFSSDCMEDGPDKAARYAHRVHLVNDQATQPQTEVLVLNRRIGLSYAIAMVIGGTIGSGIFITSSFVLKDCHSVGLTLLVWLLGGLIALLGGLCYCELANTIPKSGGTYVYLKFAYGDFFAFLYAWLDVWFTSPGYHSLASISFAIYATKPIYMLIYGTNNSGPPDWLITTVAACLLFFIGTINTISARTALIAQSIFTTAKVLAIVVIIGIGLTRFVERHTVNFQELFKGSTNSPGLIGHALYSVMYSYSGWSDLSSVTEEVRNPEKNFTRTILFSMPFVAFCYLFINAAFFSVLSPEEYVSSAAVVVTFGNKLNYIFGLIVSLVVALSCLGSLNMDIFCSCRMLASMAMEDQMPGLFVLVHRKTQTPIPALVFRIITSLLLLRSGIETLLNWLLFIGWLTYLAIFAALIMLRFTKPHLPRGYKVNITIPIIMILVSVYLAVVPFLTRPIEACYGLAVIATGVPVYYIFILKKRIPQCLITFVRKITSGIERYCNLEKPVRELLTGNG